MAIPIIKTAFSSGEIAPSLFGHVDIIKFGTGASTMRNAFVNYRGGAYSRAGTAFVGYSKQTGRSVAPRLIPFQFSVNQGLILEFGNYYMRVISDGSFVTDESFAITNITNANPAVITASAQGATAGTPVNTSVVASYAPTDTITLTGGTFSSPAVLTVSTTTLVSVQPNAGGSGYAVNDTITLVGGTYTTQAVAKVATVTNSAASGTILFSANPSNNDTVTLNGVVWTFKTTVTGANQTAIGSNITLTLAAFRSDVNASTNSSLTVATLSLQGATITVKYNTTGTAGNAYTLAASAATVSGATLSGGGTNAVGSLTVQTAGVYTANAPGGLFTQGSTSGSGTGATFQFGVFAPYAVTVTTPGVYSAAPANPVGQASTSGSGSGAQFTMTFGSVAPFSTGDWVALSGIVGMTQLNGVTAVVTNLTSSTFALHDVFGNNINSTAFTPYVSGGTAARIYTLTTPWAEADLPWLKWTQSADIMSICCWNQTTGTDYPPQDLKRVNDASWNLAPPNFAASIAPPSTTSGTCSIYGSTYYQYCITSIDSVDGSESVASPIAYIGPAGDIAQTLGQITLTWSTVPNAQIYNIYKAPPSTSGAVPSGSLFGYAGSAFGNQFIDGNIVQDLTQVPPLHLNPFAPGAITGVTINTAGTGFSQTSVTSSITTATGSGAVLVPIIVNGGVVSVMVQDGGQNYQNDDTISFNGGSGASATLRIGPQSGTYPSAVAYFQERRIYASSPNNPDTYWMSQAGAFLNFDARIPTIDSDAITGSPWSVQVDGIQFMVSMPGGLVVLTGKSAWQLTGVGGSSLNPQPITPNNQQAQPQAYNGCSSTVPPIKIDYDIIYLQSKGSIFRDFAYNFFSNIYTGGDLTIFSSHLFSGFTILQSAWSEEPFKVMWAVRNDGVLVSMTYVKSQEVIGWARHDTNGSYVSVASITEPPVDAVYVATQRFVNGQSPYLIERFDNRQWTTAETVWAVDAGLSLPQGTPGGVLTASSPTGLGSLTGVTGLVGGSGYSASTTATVVDANGSGPGWGATVQLIITGGAITNVVFLTQGQSYVSPVLVITDPTNSGSGALAQIVLNNAATFACTTPVFSVGLVGSVIRMGGGVATVTNYVDTQHVIANITSPITALIPNSKGTVAPQSAWTLTAPVSVVSGLNHLIGATVTGLADGNVIPPTQVSAIGTITLETPASAVTVGLGFEVQVQSTYVDAGNPTIQGQRKKIAAVTARMESSRDIEIGCNQPDGSVQSPIQIAPTWIDMAPVPNLVAGAYNSNFTPLYTGDVRVPVMGGFQKPGQACIQQTNPLPLQVLAFIPEILPGDISETEEKERQRR